MEVKRKQKTPKIEISRLITAIYYTGALSHCVFLLAIDIVTHAKNTEGMQRNVLLTGGTGILGSRTLLELLRDNNTHVFCPTRCQAQNSPQERVLNALKIYMPDLPTDYAERVHAYQCDLTVAVSYTHLTLPTNREV